VVVGVAVAVGVGVAVGVAVSVGEAVGVTVGEGVVVAVGVAEEMAAVQSKVPESHGGSVFTNLRVPWALPTLGNEPLTSYSPEMPGPKLSPTMLRGMGNGFAPSNWQTSPGTS